jgi:uncharacterized protein (TIGR01319 family)
MGITIAVDFGSTYTKVVAIDLDNAELLGVTQSPSTVDTDMTIALHKALEKLRTKLGLDDLKMDRIIASSSAAGGLNVVAAGLVRALTTKAAEEAALGAGAKLVGTYAYGLSSEDVKEIEKTSPDMLLLTGGTDGGNRECLIQNASLIAKSRLSIPIIVAGNKIASQEARVILEKGGKEPIVVENVLPELDQLNVEPTREVMRDTFMKRIIHAKGLDKAQALVGEIIMPTPTAVLTGARLLAEGTENVAGLGELVIVDVGGATTDVDSVAQGHPAEGDAIPKGLPEPYLKRTVEGDLGIRYNAETILEKSGKKDLLERLAAMDSSLPGKINLESAIKNLACHIDYTPQNEDDYCVDICLSCAAVETAMHRHCGRIEEAYFPTGKVRLQYGKDLTKIKCLIGTGGIFAYGREARRILQAGCYNSQKPESLRPRDPDYYIDEKYILYAVGLLSSIAPDSALKIMKKYLKKL